MAEPADVVAINFLSVRALTGLAVEQMGSGGAVCVVASIAARGWSDHVPDVEGILATPDYDAGVAWLAEHELPLPPYPFSKMATIVWALRSCRALGERGIRINTVSPGATETPMMAATFERAPETRTALEARPRALQRFSHPSEQASAIVFLNSDAASYVTGVDLHVDGGELAIDDPAVSGS
jgi:NAD(P)-dependent dehydrogenase (short-subunit alcohol dehydrogenase family)